MSMAVSAAPRPEPETPQKGARRRAGAVSNGLGAGPDPAILEDVGKDVQIDNGPAREAGTDVEQPGSFDEAYRRYAARVLNLAWRMTGNEDTAHDLAQEIWIKVYRHFDTFEARSGMYTWVHRIAVNHILNHLKRERRVRWLSILDRPVATLPHDEDAPPELERAAEPAADRAVEMDERSRRVWDAIQSLDPKYRVPLVLHHYEEMSYQDVADTMHLSMAAVESRIHRARKKLIDALGPLLNEL